MVVHLPGQGGSGGRAPGRARPERLSHVPLEWRRVREDLQRWGRPGRERPGEAAGILVRA